MSFCDEHGTSDYCADCMAEIMQKTIDYQKARIDALEAENRELGLQLITALVPDGYEQERE